MKLSADQTELADALRWVALALPTRTPYPALMGVLVDARADRLTLTAYDDLGYHTQTVPAEIEQAGQALIPGALLRDLVSALAFGKLDVSADERAAHLSTTGADYRIPLLPIDDYPPLPKPPDVVGMVDPSELARMLAAVAPAVDDTVEVKRGGVHLAALDNTLSIAGVSPSLVIYRITDWDGDDVHERMSPGLLADALRGFADAEPLTFGCSDGLVSLADSRRRAICRTYYPSDTHYARLFRVEPEPHSIIVDAVELSGALRRTALVDPATVRLSQVVGSLIVEADGAIEHVHASDPVGQFRACLGPDLLTKALRSIDGPVRLSVADNERGSVILRPLSTTETGAAVIAPKREV